LSEIVAESIFPWVICSVERRASMCGLPFILTENELSVDAMNNKAEDHWIAERDRTEQVTIRGVGEIDEANPDRAMCG
jgi:hypothetical protein